MRGCVTS